VWRSADKHSTAGSLGGDNGGRGDTDSNACQRGTTRPIRPRLSRAIRAAGFKTGSDDPHHLINRTHRDVVYLAIDDRNAGDTVIYPHDDLGRALAPDCSRMFVHSDRRPY
jgi:hypothetical protein